MNTSIDIGAILGVIMAMAFLVNIIVQMTKAFMPFPTKIWCIIVSGAVCMGTLFAGCGAKLVKLNAISFVLSLFGSFVVSFIAMYGFDTFKDLWQRFKDGENINEDN